MSKEIDDYVNEMVAANKGTKEQILQQFAKSDDADLVAYATNANKPKLEETKKTMGDLLTTPHPVLGISPADVALYGGGAALAWQAGKKLADIGIQSLSNIGGQLGNTIFGKAGPSAPSPSASTQDLMAIPDIEKPQISFEDQQMMARSEQARIDKLRYAQEADALAANRGFTTPEAAPLPQTQAPATPSVGQTVATGGNVNQAVNQTVANLVDEVPTTIPATQPVAPPEGMKPQYKPKKGEIGPGGYNWFASQVGPEQAPARWAEQYGEKNVPYKQVQSEYAATRYPVKPVPEGTKTGGAFGKPEHIPEYIKGHASMGGLLNVAGNALGIAGLAQEYKKAKKTGDWSDFGIGVANQLVSNVAPRAALPLALMTPGTLNTGEQEQLVSRSKMGPTIDRAIAPPSSYMR